MDKIHLASKMTIAGDFESSLGVSYNPLSGTMEVRIAKPSEDKMIFKVEKEITSPVLGYIFKISLVFLRNVIFRLILDPYLAIQGPKQMSLDKMDFPILGFQMRYLDSPNSGFSHGGHLELFSNSLMGIQYVPEDSSPIIFRGQYDTSNGLLASIFAASTSQKSAEVNFNYRKSDSHLTVSARFLEKEASLDGQVMPKKFKGQFTQAGIFPDSLEISEIGLDVEDRATDQQNHNGD